MRVSAIRVSIVICTRNRGNRLGAVLEALANIRSAHSWEVVMADNASTDDTAEIIGKADDCGGRLRYMHVARIGLGAARDAAWREARGELIAFTDDDCYPAPDFVDAVVNAAKRHPEAGCLGGRIMLHDPEDAWITVDEGKEVRHIPPYSFVPAGALQGANMIFRRATLERIGGIDPELGAGTRFPCEDIDALAATIWAGIPAVFDPEPTVRHHHGRREADLAGVWRGYDRGRGAYYAKFMINPASRAAYALNWRMLAMKRTGRKGALAFYHEVHTALQYLLAHGQIRRAIDVALLAARVALVRGSGIAWRRLARSGARN